MIVPGLICVAAGLVLIWLSVRMWQERLRRNLIAGVRTASTLRSDEAFRVANKAAAPLTGAGGAVLAAGGLAAVLVPKPVAGIVLFGGAIACAGLCIAGAVKGVRACR